MQQVEMEFIDEGFREILRSDAVAQVVNEQAERILSQCGEGYETHGFMGWYGSRYVAVVSAQTYEARLDTATNKTLQRAVNG